MAKSIETMNLAIRLLGAPRIDLNGEPVALPRRKTRSLLYFLAAAPGDHGRDELVDLFWPNLESAKGKRQLSDALSDLRRTFGSAAINGDTERIAWGGPAADAVEFKSLLDEAARTAADSAGNRLAAALELYSGEFLSGVRTDDSESFEEWVQDTRLGLSSAALSAFARLAAIRLEGGDPALAIEIAQRGLQRDNLREDLWRVLIQAHADLGDRAAALAEYARCRETLKRELGVVPEAETEALRRRISAEPGTPAAGTTESAAAKAKPPLPFPLRLPASSLGLVGRGRELGALLRAWESACEGAGGLAVIAGEPGIGKSRLAAEFASRAAASGAIVLAARCPDLNDPPPYGPIEEALRGALQTMPSGSLSKLGDEWLPWIGRLLPELGLGVTAPQPTSPEEDKARIAQAIGQVLDIVGGRRRLLMVIEDVHWAHPASIVLLHTLARRHRPMLVLMTVRDTEPHTEGTKATERVITDLAKEGLATTVSLGMLAARDTEALVALAIESAGAGAKANVRAVARLAEGQPLFALELTRAVLESPDDPELPESLTNAIGLRIDRASEFARRILELVAVFGRPATPQLLARAVGAEPSDETLVSAIEELTARRLLQEDDGGLVLSHALIRATVYKSLSVSRRRALHARAAAALEAGHELPAGARSDALARHYRLAGDLIPASEHLLESGGRALSMGEVDTAVRRFSEAADLLRNAGMEAGAALALEHAGEALVCGCVVLGAADKFREALAILGGAPGNDEAVGRVNVRLAEICSRWGYLRMSEDEIEPYVETAMDYVERTPDISSEERSLAYAARSFLRAGRHELDAALQDAREAVQCADPASRAYLVAKDAECLAFIMLGRYDDSLQSTLDKVPVAAALSNYFELGDAYAMAWITRVHANEPSEAEKYARLELEANKRSGLPNRIVLSTINLSEALLMQRRFDEAMALLEEHPPTPDMNDEAPYMIARRNLVLSELHAERGDLERAKAFLDQGECYDEMVPDASFQPKGVLHRARGAVRRLEQERAAVTAKG